jgi:hypothetical protein
LVTDDAGARMLVDGLGLQFTRVSTELNALAKHDPDWWNLGKIHAYHLQMEPFVHIDSDVFLWKRLPPRLEHADVFAQNPNMIFPRESGLDHNPVQRCGIIFSEGNDDEEKKDVQPRVQA